ncbi:MAG: hypothetical protein A2Y76_15625 [Planctomycetes bacterium RBG_13_60_9]|nr:MAG: hypothetical protein A2Y76_15625 [Planctomycetes bacterium RBG_13_60_9]
MWAIPQTWSMALPAEFGRRILYADTVETNLAVVPGALKQGWSVISNGRFVARPNCRLLGRELANATTDAVAVMAEPQLTAYRERIRLTRQGQLVGYRRLYQDSLEPILMPGDWPHHLFIRSEAADAVLKDGLPGEFGGLVERFRSCRLELTAVAVAGSLVDLGTKEGLLSLTHVLSGGASRHARDGAAATQGRAGVSRRNDGIAPESRLIGLVVVGDHVSVEPDAIVIGPSILCDNSRICRGAVVHSSIVGAGSEVARDQVVRDAVVVGDWRPTGSGSSTNRAPCRVGHVKADDGITFRSWGRLSYAGGFKRMADVVAAVIVLVLFAPVIPWIALAIKATSPGPVFFRHRRQGFHGRPFQCVKFRTMRVGADKLQDKLRPVSEVDGPQFKMADDPRITTVGRFLRETYLDEIPQFYNVLKGEMSVVGPRPSPESENTLCPWWRDARLSVRPGITGLWQISRTRQPMKDFQEWIHYDTEYVRKLSLRLDLWICWRTLRKMAVNFARQF